MMHREAHYWYSERIRRDMGVVVYGHYGPPMIAFPTTGGDEWEYERQGVIGAMAHAINGGRVKVFCVNTNNSDSFGNDRAHPRHRQMLQRAVRDRNASPTESAQCRAWRWLPCRVPQTFFHCCDVFHLGLRSDANHQRLTAQEAGGTRRKHAAVNGLVCGRDCHERLTGATGHHEDLCPPHSNKRVVVSL